MYRSESACGRCAMTAFGYRRSAVVLLYGEHHISLAPIAHAREKQRLLGLARRPVVVADPTLGLHDAMKTSASATSVEATS